MDGWDEGLDEAREALSDLGWETLIEPYYAQGEEKETFGKGGRYLHVAYGDVKDFPVEVRREDGHG